MTELAVKPITSFHKPLLLPSESGVQKIDVFIELGDLSELSFSFMELEREYFRLQSEQEIMRDFD
jgi:hypothetical protein